MENTKELSEYYRNLTSKMQIFNLRELHKVTGLTYNQVRMVQLGQYKSVKIETIETLEQFFASL